VVVQKAVHELESLGTEKHDSSSNSIDQINRRNIELRRVWKQTEKNLTTLIRARDAEQSIKGFFLLCYPNFVLFIYLFYFLINF